MKKTIQFAGIFALMLTFTGPLQAVPVNGTIDFGGTVSFQRSPGNSIAVNYFAAGVRAQFITSSTGDFANFPAASPPAQAIFANTVWPLNTTTLLNSFWIAGGFTFVLLSSSIISQGGTPGVDSFVNVAGTGTVGGNGFDSTPMFFTFNSQDPPVGTTTQGGTAWSFTASFVATPLATPDGGATALLLGLSLLGVTMLKKKLVVPKILPNRASLDTRQII